ncbi:DUF7261 family protein [Halomicrococcus sp. NG-SE-24]|uniref:DUF7261 family protein n=1 Tax=Halomicrococcus sp. NG-SE-24 TaxID=3436928 RepID=UPI003D97FB17
MEDVRDADRGQLILVTGLAVAVVLVSLVLLLNTVVYTENLATRGADVGGRDAVAFRNGVESGAARVVVTENANDYADAGNASENVTAGIRRYARLLESGYLERGTLATVSNVSVTNGTRLVHANDSWAFTNASSEANWTLATDVGERELRRFRVAVDREDLASSSDAFQVVADDGDDEWWASVYRNGSNVTVDTSSGTCSVDAASATVDLTAGTLANRTCGFAFAEGVDGEYAVRYVHGDQANGTYSLVVRNESSDATVQRANFTGLTTGQSPYYARAVYSATFDVRYETPRLTYATEVRVAPGERDE